MKLLGPAKQGGYNQNESNLQIKKLENMRLINPRFFINWGQLIQVKYGLIYPVAEVYIDYA